MECINRDYSTKGNNYIVAMTYYERLFNKDDIRQMNMIRMCLASWNHCINNKEYSMDLYSSRKTS